MSLPSAQQRVLDEIGDRLRDSEPRLAGMFAVFTRLTLGEPRPRREELPLRRRPRSPMAGLRRGGLRRSGLERGESPTRRRRYRASVGLAFIACQVAAAAAILGLIFSLGVRAVPKSCSSARQRGPAVTRVTMRECRAQAGLFGYPVPLSK